MLKEDLIDYINNEPLDMLDDFTDEEIADCVLSVAKKLRMCKVAEKTLIRFGTPNTVYHIKVNNVLKGFVSVSDECSTGVSRTEYYPFFSDEEDGEIVGLFSLASMINEAWYYCKN